jgi:hypothetical protein
VVRLVASERSVALVADVTAAPASAALAEAA